MPANENQVSFDPIASLAWDAQIFEVLDRLPIGAYTCDADGLITYFNKEAVRVWGRTPKLLDPQDRWCGSLRMFSALDGSPMPHAECWMAKAILTGQPHVGEELIIERPDGTKAVGLAHANPIRNKSGEIVGALNIVVDISDRTRADNALARLGAIVESSDDAIVGKTLDGIVVTWNGAAERLFGYTAAEVVGNSIMMIIPPDRHDEERQILAKLTRGERVEHYETVRIAKNGRELHISLTSSPIRDSRGRIIGASKIARDVTARKENEEKLRVLHEELRKADRAKTEFLATLAHELRNPLAPIQNMVGVLQMERPSPTTLRNALGVVERQLSQMTRLIDDLLDISRISKDKLELRRENIDLSQVLEAAIEACRPLLSARGHEFRVDLPPEPIVVNGDLARLAQVVANLLNNAAKYTPRGGRIQLEGHRDGNSAYVTVRDTGLGIPPEKLDKIFEMFTQLEQSIDRSEGGLGIGLHLAQRLAEMHGGSLSAASKGKGEGSTFTFRLPVVAATKQARQANDESGQHMPHSMRLRVLVVDDNRDAADSLKMLLELAGNEVCVAYDGLHAIEMARTFRPDVALLDLGLPGLDGYEVAARVRSESWGAAITLIALTGWGQDEARARSRRAGFDEHLTKPIDPKSLLQQLAGIARGNDALATMADGPPSNGPTHHAKSTIPGA